MTQHWSWCGWLPPRPAVPPLLWATLGAGTVAGLNLIFYAEVWSHGRAGTGAWVAPLALALLAGPQVALVLWRWPPPVAASFWVQGLWRTTLRLAAAGGILAVFFGALGLMMLLLSANWELGQD